MYLDGYTCTGLLNRGYVMSQSLRVLLTAAEVAPMAKVGGLADVAGALPKALCALGHDARIMMPAYAMVVNDPRWNARLVVESFPVPLAHGEVHTGSVWEMRLADQVVVWLIGHPVHYTQSTDSTKLYAMEAEPYLFFCRAVPEALLALDWRPDIIHANDWHTGLIPAYLRESSALKDVWSDTGVVYTIHNLAYQGDWDRTLLEQAGLPDRLYNMNQMEANGRVNLLKTGAVFSDAVNTVSPTYAREICTPEYGCGLDGLMRWLHQQGRLSGILNGIDYETYDPASDRCIAAPFSAADPSGKLICRAALERECGFDADPTSPLMGWISRLADQKAPDLVVEAAATMLQQGIRLVLLGVGDPIAEKAFQDLQQQYPKQVCAFIRFDVELAQRIYAGSDLFLMPSRFEPCGLGQLMALRYGAIPVVRRTGGLADTIVNWNEGARLGNGFVFDELSVDGLCGATARAVQVFRGHPETWRAIMQFALESDFSWPRAAVHYQELYTRVVSLRRS